MHHYYNGIKNECDDDTHLFYINAYDNKRNINVMG